MDSKNSRNALPPLTVPLLYLCFGTVCFGFAMAGVIRYAQDFTGFYYHPRILALTHLVTLGWITGNILGSLYLVAGISLSMQLPYGWRDHVIFWFYAVGVSGMASHFWLQDYPGMLLAGFCVYSALLLMSLKIFRAARRARIPGFVKFYIFLAFANILLAGLWGLMIGVNKIRGFLPTSSSPNVIAHAHLAAAGWGMIIVFGISYRLLPMFLPAAPAKGLLPWISGILMEAGVMGLFFSLLSAPRLAEIFAFLLVGGIVIFLITAARTALNRKPAPPPVPPKPDFAMLQVLFSFICLILSTIAGLLLLRLPATEATLQLALAYGFVAIVGFLGQMIIAMKPKILSILTWYYVFQRTGETSIPRPVDMPVRFFQAVIFFLWLLGIPLSAIGILRSSRLSIVAGSLALLSGLVISVIHEIWILRRLFAGTAEKS